MNRHHLFLILTKLKHFWRKQLLHNVFLQFYISHEDLIFLGRRGTIKPSQLFHLIEVVSLVLNYWLFFLEHKHALVEFSIRIEYSIFFRVFKYYGLDVARPNAIHKFMDFLVVGVQAIRKTLYYSKNTYIRLLFRYEGWLAQPLKMKQIDSLSFSRYSWILLLFMIWINPSSKLVVYS